MRTKLLLAVALGVALVAPAARAIDIGDGKMSVNGNGEWWYGKANQNRYLGADSDGTWNNAMFDLLVNARPTEDITLSSQLGFDQSSTSLEWLFGEWRVADALRLRVGKAKQPLGNYSELQFVGTARPFLTLPTSVYGTANIAVPAYVGGGATGTFLLGAFELSYDVYGGTQNVTEYNTYDMLRFASPPDGVNRPARNVTLLVEDLLGGRVSVTFPFDLVLRLSAYTGHVEKYEDLPKARANVAGVSAWWRNDRIWFSAEGFRALEKGWDDQLSGYAELAVFVLPQHLQVAGRWESARVRIPGFALGSSPLLRHDEAALGVSWWFTPQIVWKASAHFVRGQRFTRYEGEGGVWGSQPSNRTNLFVSGISFTY